MSQAHYIKDHRSSTSKAVSSTNDKDFVITTYSVVETEYRKNVLPEKQKCWCGKLFHDALLAHHRAFICYQEYAVENNKQSNRGRVRMLGWMLLISRWISGSLGRRIYKMVRISRGCRHVWMMRIQIRPSHLYWQSGNLMEQ